jgi:hypothetical protein
VRRDLRRRPSLEQEGRMGHRRSQPPEPAAQGSAEIQHPEVKPRRSLDEYTIASGHTL